MRRSRCARGLPSAHNTNWRFERHHILLLALSQPCFVLGRPHPSLPLLGMRATTGRKGLLVGVTGVALRPATPLGDAGFVWEEGVVVEGWWRSSRGRLLDDESVIEMESVCRHYSPNQLS